MTLLLPEIDNKNDFQFRIAMFNVENLITDGKPIYDELKQRYSIEATSLI